MNRLIYAVVKRLSPKRKQRLEAYLESVMLDMLDSKTWDKSYEAGRNDKEAQILNALKALPCDPKGCDGCTALQILDYNDILKEQHYG